MAVPHTAPTTAIILLFSEQCTPNVDHLPHAEYCVSAARGQRVEKANDRSPKADRPEKSDAAKLSQVDGNFAGLKQANRLVKIT